MSSQKRAPLLFLVCGLEHERALRKLFFNITKTSQRHARRIRNRRRPNRRHGCRLPLGRSSGAFVRSAGAFPVGVVLRLSFQARKFWQSAPVRDIRHRWPHIFAQGLCLLLHIRHFLLHVCRRFSVAHHSLARVHSSCIDAVWSGRRTRAIVSGGAGTLSVGAPIWRGGRC